MVLTISDKDEGLIDGRDFEGQQGNRLAHRGFA